MARKKDKWGLVQVYTGTGKGKTTASLGLAIRALGRGKKVAIIYYDKGGDNYGERHILNKLDGIDYYVFGLDRIDPHTGYFRFGMTDEDYQEISKAWKLTQELALKEYDLIILDEINNYLDNDALQEKDVVDFLKQKPEDLELVLTGRNCPELIRDNADLVSEIKPNKHYFDKGVIAREGLEY